MCYYVSKFAWQKKKKKNYRKNKLFCTHRIPDFTESTFPSGKFKWQTEQFDTVNSKKNTIKDVDRLVPNDIAWVLQK